jgi:hypothetical protein
METLTSGITLLHPINASMRGNTVASNCNMAFSDTRNTKGQVRAKPIRDALYALLSRPAEDALTDKPTTMAQRIAMELMRDAISTDAKTRIDARSELIDRTDGKAIQAVEHSGFIASHEEQLAALDNPESDDTTGEGTKAPSP